MFRKLIYRIGDLWIEILINFTRKRMIAAKNNNEKRLWAVVFHDLIEQRRPEQIDRMRKKQGLI